MAVIWNKEITNERMNEKRKKKEKKEVEYPGYTTDRKLASLFLALLLFLFSLILFFSKENHYENSSFNRLY